MTFDKQTVNRITNIQALDEENKSPIFAILDTFLRDAKTRQAYSK